MTQGVVLGRNIAPLWGCFPNTLQLLPNDGLFKRSVLATAKISFPTQPARLAYSAMQITSTRFITLKY